MESGREDPPEKVWEGIQDELDLDKVWGRVEGSLNASRRNIPFMLRAIAASFLLLLASATMLHYFVLSDFSEPGRPQVADRPDTFIPERIPGSQQVADRPDTFIPDRIPGIQPERIPDTDQRETLQLAESDLMQKEPVERLVELPAEDEMTTRPTLADAPDMPADAPDMLADTPDSPTFLTSKPGFVADSHQNEKTISTYLAARHEDDIPDKDIADMDLPGQRPAFFVGINGQMGNTWMLNSKTIGGLSANDITDTRTSYGGSYGIVAGSQLFPRLRAQAGLDLLAKNRQRYNEYIRGQYVSTEFQLDYSRLSVFFSFTPWEQRPWVVHGGAYSAYIRNAEQQINGQAEEISGQYTNTDYGVIAGLGYLHPMAGPFELHTGIFANYGLKNVFAGSDYTPASLNNTRLISFQMSVSLHYHIQR